MLTINIIGGGCVGQTLGNLLVKHQAATIQSVLNSTVKSSQNAINFIGQGQICVNLKDLPPADLIILTVPDQQIAPMVQAMYSHLNLRPGTIIMHCSGVLNSNALATLRDKQCIVASLHPALSFHSPSLSVRQFAHCSCVVEGDEAALKVLIPLFTGLGAKIYSISSQQKTKYHMAAVFATNYIVTLVQQAYEGFLNTGLDKVQAKQLTNDFLSSVVENVKSVEEPKQALTGPLQRGDVVTIERHLTALTDQQDRILYLAMAKATLALTSLDEKITQELKNLVEAEH